MPRKSPRLVEEKPAETGKSKKQSKVKRVREEEVEEEPRDRLNLHEMRARFSPPSQPEPAAAEEREELEPQPQVPANHLLKASMDAVGAKVDAVMTAVQALETRTDNKMEELDSSLAETTSKLIDQGLQLDRLDADVRTISTFDGTLDEVKDEVLTLQRDTDSNIEQGVWSIETKLDEKFKGLCELAAAQETKLNRLDQKVDVLQVTVTQTKGKVHAMELSVHHKLDLLMGRVEELIAFNKAIPVAVQEP